MKSKTIGIILLVVAALAILGSIANGTFASIGEKSIPELVGYFGAMIACIVGGIVLIGKDKK